MATIGEQIEDEIAGFNEHVSRIAGLLEHVRAVAPRLLEMEFPAIGAYSRSLALFDHGNHQLARDAVLYLMELAGLDRVTKELAFNHKDRIARVRLDGLDVHVWFEGANGCKKYRVTKEEVIEACGELDPSQYLSVVEIPCEAGA